MSAEPNLIPVLWNVGFLLT